MLPEKGVPSAVVGTVRRWCQHYAAGLEESSTGEVPRLQKFCHHNCWVLAAPRQLSAESAECCQTRDGSCRPSREAPARTSTGEPGIALWTWRALGWTVNGVRVMVVVVVVCHKKCLRESTESMLSNSHLSVSLLSICYTNRLTFYFCHLFPYISISPYISETANGRHLGMLWAGGVLV